MNAYESTLLDYAQRLLSAEQLQLILDNDVALYGENSLRRYLGEISIEAFIRLYFYDEFTLSFASIHNDMIADMQQIMENKVNNKAGIKIARAIPRGHAKSTFYSRVLPLHGLLYGWSSLTVLLGNNDDAAKRLNANIKNAIETNAAILQDFPNIKGTYWGNEKLTASNGATITSFGIGSGSIRGVSTGEHRPSLIILDDIDDNRSVRSAVELTNNKEWLDKDVLPLGDNVAFTTSFVVVGTIIRRTSLMKYILDSAIFKSRIESAVIHFAHNESLWEQWKENILQLAREDNQPTSPDEDTFYQQHKEAMLEGTQMLWERQDAYWYAQMSRLQNEGAFWSELQNAPIAADSMFGTPRFISAATINEKEYDVIAGLDPTIQGNRHNDLAAYVEVLYHRKEKKVIVWYVDAKRRSYSDTINAVAQRIKTRGRMLNGFFVEDNAHGLIVKDLINERFRQERIPLQAIGIYNTAPKNDRIGVLSEYIARGDLLFVDTVAQELKDELSNWPMSQTDDVLDAIALIIGYLRDKNMLARIEINEQQLYK